MSCLAHFVHGVPVRLPAERWIHITEEHCEMSGRLYDVLETIENPEAIYEGSAGELLAARQTEAGKYLVGVYREQESGDGFVITAFLTRRIRQLERRRKVWPR